MFNSRIRAIYSYYSGKIKLNYFAPTVFIEPTNICNFRCLICPQSVGLNAPQGYMDLDLYKEILTKIKDISSRVILHLFGESLLHPEIDRMIRLAKEQGLRTKIHTNASLLTEEKAKKILASGLDRIVFSFNGGELRKDYEKISVGGDYDRIIDNIKNFLRIKKERGLKFPVIGFEIIKIPKKGQETPIISQEFREMFSEGEFDCLPAHHWSGKIEQRKALNLNHPAYSYPPCQHPWNELCISWDGVVVGCCLDATRTFILGDVKKETLEELWNGERMQWLREKLIKGEYKDLDLCRNCHRLWADKSEPNPIKWIIKKTITWLG